MIAGSRGTGGRGIVRRATGLAQVMVTTLFADGAGTAADTLGLLNVQNDGKGKGESGMGVGMANSEPRLT